MHAQLEGLARRYGRHTANTNLVPLHSCDLHVYDSLQRTSVLQ